MTLWISSTSLTNGKNKWKPAETKKFRKEWWQGKGGSIQMNRERISWTRRREKGINTNKKTLVIIPKYSYWTKSKCLIIANTMNLHMKSSIKTILPVPWAILPLIAQSLNTLTTVITLMIFRQTNKIWHQPHFRKLKSQVLTRKKPLRRVL